MANTKEVLDGATPLARNFAEKVHNYSGIAEKATQDFGNRIGSAVEGISGQTSEYVDTTRKYVTGHPIQSVLMAAAAGLVCGSLITMASRSK